MNLCDGNLVLRAIEPADSRVLYELLADPAVEGAVIGWSGPVSHASQLDWINSIQPNDFRFMVQLNGEALGTVRIHPLDLKNRTGTINIKLLDKGRGKGLGRRTMQLLLRYMFFELDLRVATATVLESNIASRGLFESLGFVEEGLLRSRIFKNGKAQAVVSFSLLKSEFASGQET